jgi:hypothetical protein
MLLAIKFNDQRLDKAGVTQMLELIEKYIEVSPKEVTHLLPLIHFFFVDFRRRIQSVCKLIFFTVC